MDLTRAASRSLLEMTSLDVDVLILGGGINGVGVLREMAANGVSALLVDKGDFCTGATSASSRMIHGGLRYMEQGEFRLVREALHERNRLLKHAPALVKPLPTTIPLFSRWSGLLNSARKFFRGSDKPSRRGSLIVKIGLSLYDVFSGKDRDLPRHRMSSRREALARRSKLNPGIVGTATYYDAWVAMPERLCLEYLADALQRSDRVHALNYCLADGLGSDGRVRLCDQLRPGRELWVRPRAVVNATGAWIDIANTALEQPSHFIGGTKGSHLILDHPELYRQLDGEQVFYENEDGRICICYPLFDKVLLGSTDIRIENPDEAVCSDEEVGYILDSLKGVFPGLRVDSSHVISRYCGVRPLPASDSSYTGRISRDHICREQPAIAGRPWPVYSLVGGKWTTFQAFAEQVADRVFNQLDVTRKERPRVMGTSHEQVQPRFDDEGALRAILADEAVVHLDDFLLRRTPIGLCERMSSERFESLASLAADVLKWSPERLNDEKCRTLETLSNRHGVKLT